MAWLLCLTRWQVTRCGQRGMGDQSESRLSPPGPPNPAPECLGTISGTGW